MSQNCHDHRRVVVLRLRPGFSYGSSGKIDSNELDITPHRPAHVRPTELKLWAHAARDNIKPRDLRGVDKFNTFTSVSWANLTLRLVGLNKRNSVLFWQLRPAKAEQIRMRWFNIVTASTTPRWRQSGIVLSLNISVFVMLCLRC